ncbi:hypothetical protein TrRE_jg11210 [Triparma retinervis]|jgi:hypothetical protein|uniref:BART domain-containing protein n=1 Tax=Triparma retinervis TaxID=2557542 RepID=A0A9W7CPT2_9STRA|nr:hypothetical protein TrRE_jg11210 [Triparma retinervis]
MPPSTPEGTELIRKTAYHFEELFTDDEDLIDFFTDAVEHFEDEFEETKEEEEESKSKDKEHKMIYMDLYKDFESLMEQKILIVAEKMGFDDAADFFGQLQETLNEKEGYAQGELEQATFDAVLSSYDYTAFVKFMRKKAEGKAKMAAAFGV